MMKEIMATDKKIEIFSHSKKSAPLIVYNAVQNEGNEIWQTCSKIKCPEFSLAVVNNIKWHSEMSPWKIPPVFKKGEAFTGNADYYISKLADKILPEICTELSCRPDKIIIAGYSLAGLFALYSAFKTDIFSGIISASGSLWYPEIINFVKNHKLSKNIKSAYFSVGNKESHTKNPFMCQVEENTRKIERYLNLQNLKTIFELNPGNHFADASFRTAKGIKWTLTQNI